VPTFEPLGAETRIVLPDAVGPVVHGRMRLFLSDNAAGYTATAGEGTWLGIAGKPESVTIYDVIGLSSTVLEDLARMILASSEAIGLYVRLPNGTVGRFTTIEVRKSP